MIFAELLGSVGWPDIKAALLQCFPDAARSLESCRLMQEELRQLVPEESDMRIMVKESFTEGIDDEPYNEVVGRNGRLTR